jgi:5'(3')-deoxyribonucleotidase
MDYEYSFNSFPLRQYSITCEIDANNIKNNRCPDYALNWSHNYNKLYWRNGHDYFLGNGINVTDNAELREILSEKLTRGTLPNKIIFCDLDGVLADFDQGVLNRFHKLPCELNPGTMWSVINKSKTFFNKLPWTPRGRELWEQIRQYDPIILTGIPNNPTAAKQKREWCARELGPDIHVITCQTKDKPKYCINDSILIDDRTVNMDNWNARGGKFVLYDEEIFDAIVERIHKYIINYNV